MYSNAFIWAKVIAYLDERMTPGIVSTYFDQSYVLDCTDRVLTVYAPSEFCKDFIERRCLGYIQDAMQELTAQEQEVLSGLICRVADRAERYVKGGDEPCGLSDNT